VAQIIIQRVAIAPSLGLEYSIFLSKKEGLTSLTKACYFGNRNINRLHLALLFHYFKIKILKKIKINRGLIFMDVKPNPCHH
jgi:hypothetical protein